MRRSDMDSPPGAVLDQLGDIINGKPEDPLHVFGVGRHIGALDYHGAHLGVPVYEFFSSILKPISWLYFTGRLQPRINRW